jgi:hypothetical protein
MAIQRRRQESHGSKKESMMMDFEEDSVFPASVTLLTKESIMNRTAGVPLEKSYFKKSTIDEMAARLESATKQSATATTIPTAAPTPSLPVLGQSMSTTMTTTAAPSATTSMFGTPFGASTMQQSAATPAPPTTFQFTSANTTPASAAPQQQSSTPLFGASNMTPATTGFGGGGGGFGGFSFKK